MYFIDTNIFLRFFTGDLPREQKDCITLLTKCTEGSIEACSSQLVVAEIVWTLNRQYKFSKSQTVDAVKSVFNLGIDFTERYNTLKAVSLYETKKIKYIDCLIASIPQIASKKWTVVSYDKDFDKLGMNRIEPKDII